MTTPDRAAMAQAEAEDYETYGCPTVRRYPRTLADAFPAERAACIEHVHVSWWTRLRLHWRDMPLAVRVAWRLLLAGAAVLALAWLVASIRSL